MKLKAVITTEDICAGMRCNARSEYTLSPAAHKLPYKGNIGFCDRCWNKRCAEIVQRDDKAIRKPAAVAQEAVRKKVVEPEDRAGKPLIRMRRKRRWC